MILLYLQIPIVYRLPVGIPLDVDMLVKELFHPHVFLALIDAENMERPEIFAESRHALSEVAGRPYLDEDPVAEILDLPDVDDVFHVEPGEEYIVIGNILFVLVSLQEARYLTIVFLLHGIQLFLKFIFPCLTN